MTATTTAIAIKPRENPATHPTIAMLTLLSLPPRESIAHLSYPEYEMEIDFAFLANYAEATPNGLVTAVGAGWDNAWRTSYPASFSGYLVARLTLTRQEMTHAHNVELDIVDADGHATVPRISMPIEPPPTPGVRLNMNLLFDLRGVVVSNPGSYNLELGVDGRSLKSFGVTFNPEGQTL
jgi:hypothetical protein